MSECIFCKIAKGEIPADFVYRDETVFVIRDITPQAPAHFLVIPTRHVASAAEVADLAIWAAVMGRATEVARSLGFTDGYRMVINTGVQSGQTVPHLHLHLLSGRVFGWPPG
ncbi:MAG: histidine triad nucleotide-binding protein [Synergistaceae bacterium]|jgi:histidine triad (HIT) family protein|nr:histidine triad nucleotide-binding protein [Synergistaceae bacterium]